VILLVGLASMGGLALLAPLLERRLGRDAGYPLAAGFVAVAILLAAVAPGAMDGGVAVSWRWLPAFGVSFALRLDGLTSLFCLLVLGVGALIMMYCPRYLAARGRHGLTYFLLTLFGGAMLGLVLSEDLVSLYAFWELTSVVSFFLIGTSGARSVRPAVRGLLVTGMGGLALLVAVVLLASVVGTTDLASVLAARRQVLASPLAPVVAALVIVAAFTKSAQWPFHFWLPGAMVAITPVSAYLHAATMVKAGIYLLLRFSTVFAGRPVWALTLTGVGLVTAVLGAAEALREHDLKALLAYSTVSQLGLLVAAVGVGTTVALAAAILHTFAHALFKATARRARPAPSGARRRLHGRRAVAGRDPAAVRVRRQAGPDPGGRVRLPGDGRRRRGQPLHPPVHDQDLDRRVLGRADLLPERPAAAPPHRRDAHRARSRARPAIARARRLGGAAAGRLGCGGVGPARHLGVRARGDAMIRPWRALAFLGHYTRLFLAANAVVAWEILRPGSGLEPAVVELRLRTRTTLEVTALAYLILLTPGTLVLEVRPGALLVHGMHAADLRERLDDLQDRLLAVLRG
jgi:NADH:ubiquinone oxidoreductase subunit 2 (subunit N)/multisubunit Na+/H+ antiporter MnhE subunit